MKTRFLILLLVVFFANLWTAQTLVKPAEFKFSDIASYLKGKGYTVLEETTEYIELKTKNNVDVFLDIDAKKQAIYYSTNILTNTSASRDKIQNYVEKANEIPVIKVVHIEDKQKVMFEYCFWIKYGFTLETFEHALSEFALYVGDALGLDKEQQILQ